MQSDAARALKTTMLLLLLDPRLLQEQIRHFDVIPNVEGCGIETEND
jgi:hypothetical protein